MYFNDGDSFRIQAGPFKGTQSRLSGYNTLESFGPAHAWGTWHPYELWINAKLATYNGRRGIWHCTSDGSTDTQIGALIAIVGFFFGVGMTTDGMLSPVRDYLKSFRVDVFGVTNPAIWDLFGGSITAKWATIAVFCIVTLVFVFKGKPTFGKSGKGYAWGLTGVLVGLLTVIAWEVSSVFGGAPRGLAITTPLRELFNSMLTKSTHSPFQEFSFLGIFTGTWGVFFILAVPIGAWLSALGLKEFKWKITPAAEFLTVFFGSILMGIGAVIATFVLIYLNGGNDAIVSYAKNLLWFVPPWIAYVVSMIAGVPRFGFWPAMIGSLVLYLGCVGLVQIGLK